MNTTAQKAIKKSGNSSSGPYGSENKIPEDVDTTMKKLVKALEALQKPVYEDESDDDESESDSDSDSSDSESTRDDN